MTKAALRNPAPAEQPAPARRCLHQPAQVARVQQLLTLLRWG